MHPTTSWADMTPETASAALAERFFELTFRPATAAEKRASATDFLASLGEAARSNPGLTGTLAGGLGGAALGGLTAGTDASGRKKNVLSRMLTGGLAGAAAGGGIGMAAGFGRGPQGVSHGDALGKGEFVDPASGRKVSVDPSKMRSDPDAVAKVRELSSADGGFRRMSSTMGKEYNNLVEGGVQGNLWNLLRRAGIVTRALPGSNDGKMVGDDTAPISAQILPSVAMADAVTSSGLNTGERVGLGRVRPEYTNDPSVLRDGAGEWKVKGEGPEGLKAKLQSNAGGISSDATRNVSGAGNLADPSKPLRSRSWLERLTGRGQSDSDVLYKETFEPTAVTKEKVEVPGKVDKHGNQVTGEGPPTKVKIRNGQEDLSLTRADVKDLNRKGFLAQEKALNHEGGRQIFRVGGKDFRLSPGVKNVGRGLLYAGLPALEYMTRDTMAEMNREKTLRELMGRLTKNPKE